MGPHACTVHFYHFIQDDDIEIVILVSNPFKMKLKDVLFVTMTIHSLLR